MNNNLHDFEQFIRRSTERRKNYGSKRARQERDCGGH